MTTPLRIDRDAMAMTWGKFTFAITNLRKISSGFAFRATPEGFSPAEIEVYPERNLMICDRVCPHTLTNYRVVGHVATAETAVREETAAGETRFAEINNYLLTTFYRAGKPWHGTPARKANPYELNDNPH